MDYYISTTSALVAGITALGLWIWHRNQKSNGLPPGPVCWPLLGNIPQVILEGKKPLFQVALAWREKYGDVFLMKMGAMRVVWVSGLELGREVLVQRGEDFDHRAKWLYTPRESKRSEGLVYNDGPVFTKLKPILARATQREGVGDKTIEERIHEEVSACAKELIRIANQNEAVQLDSLFKNSFVNLLYGLVLGKRLEYGDDKLSKWVELIYEIKVLNKSVQLADMFPCLGFLPFARINHLALEKIGSARQIVLELIREHEKTFACNNPRDLIDLCLEANKKGADLSDLNISGVVLDSFFADTDGEKFLWIIGFIVGHQEVQNKCRDEIMKVIGQNRQVTSDDRERLPYTYATMHEAFRYGGTQVSIPRATVKDTNIGGYKVPKQTSVIVSLCSIHLDPTFWKDPLTFKPERFIDANGKFNTFDHYYPYGMGNRKCTSWDVADRALFLFFATLLQRFEFVTPEGHEPIDLRGIQVAPHIPFRPKPFYVKVKEYIS